MSQSWLSVTMASASVSDSRRTVTASASGLMCPACPNPTGDASELFGDDRDMSDGTQRPDGLRIVTVGPDGNPVDDPGVQADSDEPVSDMVEQPAKVMRIGTM